MTRSRKVTTQRESPSLVYTAFNGDDFALVSRFARIVFSSGRVPLNPEACLGYYSSYQAFRNKQSILLHDVALLKLADELWIFDDAAHRGAWGDLAEGTAIELLSFLRLKGGRARVSSVSSSSVRMRLRGRRRTQWVSESEVLAAFPDEDATVLLRLVDDFTGSTIPEVCLALFDERDAKYSEWVRDWILRHGLTPLVPFQAFDSATLSRSKDLHRGVSVVSAVVSRAVYIAHFPDQRPKGVDWPRDVMAQLLRRSVEVKSLAWEEVGTPKEAHGRDWPLLPREKSQLSDLAGRRPAILEMRADG